MRVLGLHFDKLRQLLNINCFRDFGGQAETAKLTSLITHGENILAQAQIQDSEWFWAKTFVPQLRINARDKF